MVRRCPHHVVPEPSVCELCAVHFAAQRRRTRSRIVGGLLLLPVAGVAIYLFTLPAPPPPPPRSTEPDNIVAFQRERLAATPCEPKTSMSLVERLMELTRWQDAKVAAEASLRDCGVIGRMKWRLAYINQQLHHWQDTVKITGELIADHPQDSDFWWWRGEAWSDGKQPLLALADYRQSLALVETVRGGQFAAHRIYTPAKAAGALCEAARAWTYYVRQIGGAPSQDMRDETAALVRDKTCVPEHGTGRVSLGERARVTIEGASASFEIDAGLGTTLVSRLFLAQTGLVSSSTERAHAQSGGVVYTGEPMRLTVRAGNASARNVDVLITDDLPGDAPGILGLSFLWHFDVEYTDDQTVLSPPAGTAL
jgi:Aspartyl protease